MLNRKTVDIIDSIASVLSIEKAGKIPLICQRYDLGNGNDYSSPGSKFTYIKNQLLDKSSDFIVNLSERLIKDYKSDAIGSSLNQLMNGNYYKLSEITRKNLLSDLIKIGNLNGQLSIDDFLKKCELEYIKQTDNSFNYFSNDEPQDNQIELEELLRKSAIHEILDEKYFVFLEQIIHPYVRTNVDSVEYISIINSHIKIDNFELRPASDISGEQIYKISQNTGIKDSVKNLIFAADGYKPEIVLVDALSNDLKIVKNSEYCLVYNEPLKSTGLQWVDLVKWWANSQEIEINKAAANGLNDRLFKSLDSEPEKILFKTYYNFFSKKLARKLPALVPQVYLHYDPYSIKQYGIQYLLRQRMDFLLLLSNSTRIVIEVDGKQHYAEENIASPRNYSEMVSLDRDLKLLGYEVYRFGGFELTESSNEKNIVDFFNKLFIKHGITE